MFVFITVDDNIQLKLKDSCAEVFGSIAPGTHLLLLNVGIFRSASGSSITAFNGAGIRILNPKAAEAFKLKALPAPLLPQLSFAPYSGSSFTVRNVTLQIEHGAMTIADSSASFPCTAPQFSVANCGSMYSMQAATFIHEGLPRIDATNAVFTRME